MKPENKKEYIGGGDTLEIEKNKIIYNHIKSFIDKYFPEYKELKEGNCLFISLKNNPIWFEFDIKYTELIVGYEVNHIHYGEQYGIKISKGLNQLLDFFISKIKRTDYYKGKVNFKCVYEIKKENGTFENLRTKSILIYPFWKKTTKKVTEYSIIKDENIKTELERLRERINNLC